MKETILRKIVVRDPDGVPGEITFGLDYCQGNAQSHWAVTAWFCGQDRNGHQVEHGGCCHDVILKIRPELAPFVALHLSDADGAPMHAVANGWYAMAGAMNGAGETYHAGNGKVQHWKPDGSFDGYRESTPEECLIQCANHLRITRQQAANLRDECLALVTHNDPESFGYKNGCRKAKEYFAERVNAMRPRWAQESAEALKLIQ